ncbi:hypothetical protein GCM10010232_49800 [Streptomyces amakusaensis]
MFHLFCRVVRRAAAALSMPLPPPRAWDGQGWVPLDAEDDDVEGAGHPDDA